MCCRGPELRYFVVEQINCRLLNCSLNPVQQLRRVAVFLQSVLEFEHYTLVIVLCLGVALTLTNPNVRSVALTPRLDR